MAVDHWSRVGTLFEDTLALPPRERNQFLVDACGGDGDLREEVESLLAAHADANGEFLKKGQVARLMQWGDVALDQPPKQVGPWRVVSEIGRGGMGVVYEARRADGQFEQTAALKLIKRGMDSDHYLERFLRERQILARMDHPGIARLLDGGVTPEGRPWFALERIDGVHLTQHCSEKKLSVDQRLRLFNEVCSAVEYAHRNLVVHRDLKPSNVLVDTDGRVKLLDFGIAKILRDTGDTKGTRTVATGRFVTPGYGAPELLRGGAVTTATDVYSLGVMLDELLSGKRPGRPSRDSSTAPSTEVTGSTPPDRASLSAEASAHGGLDCDLATIAAKATQSEPTRRYVSAEALREDVARYLRGEPVRACPDSLMYRARKFLNRHRMSTTLAGLAVLSLVVGLGTALWQAGVAARERDIAREESEQSEQVKKFMVDLFRASDPRDLDGADLTAEKLIERGLGRVRSGLEDRPDLRAELLTTIGEVSRSLGDHEGARQLFEEASVIDLGPEPRNQLRHAAALNGLGTAWAHLGDAERAASHHRRALTIRSEFADADSTTITQSLNNLGVGLAMQGKQPEAIELYTRALEIQERVVGPDAIINLQTLSNLGVAHRLDGDFLKAERYLTQAVERMSLHGQNRSPELVNSLNHLGSVQARLGRVRAAERLKRQSLELSLAYWGESHSETHIAMVGHAIALHVLGNHAEAVPLMRKGLEGDIEQLGPNHAFVATGRDNLASMLLEWGQVDEALAQFEISAAIHEGASDGRSLAIHQVRHAAAQLAAGNVLVARQLVDRGLAAERQRTPLNNERLTTALMTSGLVRTSLGLLAEAETRFDEAQVLIGQRANPDHPDAGIASFGLGELYLAQGRIAEARLALERASKVWAEALPEGHWHRAEAQIALGACEILDGNVERGRQLMGDGITQLQRDRGETHWRTLAAIGRREALSRETSF